MEEKLNKMIWKTEEEMQIALKERLDSWKPGYSRDGFILQANGIFEYNGIKYLINVLRYFNHTNKFTPMGSRISDAHVVVETPIETKPLADLVQGIDGVYDFLYHDTNHSFNDGQPLEEQIEVCHKWAKEDIDSLLGGKISQILNKGIEDLQKVKDKLDKIAGEKKK